MPRIPSLIPRPARAALALAGAWFAVASLPAAPLFPGRQHEVGVTPVAVVAADFDGDGEMDLASANENTGDIVVLFSRGGDDFAAGPHLGSGLYPSSLVAVDFDADGRVDLAAANAGSDDVAVFRGRGDGSFAAALRLPAGSGPVALAVADLNGDRLPELIAANAYSDDLSIFAGLPGGGFAPETRLGLPSGPLSIAPVDLDRDGPVDLVVALWISGQIAWLRNRGDGTFQPAVRTTLADSPAAIRAADFDADDRPDLAVALQGGSIVVLPGRGDGSLGPPRTVGDVGGPPAALEVMQVDPGASIDIVVAAGDAALFLGRGNGAFDPPLRCGGLNGPAGVAAADFDGDGTIDLAFANSYGDDPYTAPDDVAILFGRGDGSCLAPVFSESEDGRVMAIADFDGDRRPDVAVLQGGVGDLVLRRGLGDGSFDPPRPIAAGGGAGSIIAADFDLDGHADLAQTHFEVDTVSIRLGYGDGTFAPAVTFGTVDEPRDLAAGRLDGNRFPDLVVSTGSGRDVAVMRGRGDGTFGPAQVLQAGLTPTGVAIGDVDGDHAGDLVVVSYADDSLSIFRGHGDGGFDPPVSVSVGTIPTSVALRPLGDGRSEAVVGFGRGRRVQVVRGLGDGLYAVAQASVSGSAAWAVAVGDLDRDGRPDIASANRHSGNVSAIAAEIPGPLSFGAGSEPRELAIADVNSDGRKDIVVLLASALAVLLNQGIAPGLPAVDDFEFHPAAAPGAFAIGWRTSAETDIAGFRLMSLDRTGAVAMERRVDCAECTTGLGAAYRLLLPRPSQGRIWVLEVLRTDGSSERVGPAAKSAPGRSGPAGKVGPGSKQGQPRQPSPIAP